MKRLFDEAYVFQQFTSENSKGVFQEIWKVLKVHIYDNHIEPLRFVAKGNTERDAMSHWKRKMILRRRRFKRVENPIVKSVMGELAKAIYIMEDIKNDPISIEYSKPGAKRGKKKSDSSDHFPKG